MVENSHAIGKQRALIQSAEQADAHRTLSPVDPRWTSTSLETRPVASSVRRPSSCGAATSTGPTAHGGDQGQSISALDEAEMAGAAAEAATTLGPGEGQPMDTFPAVVTTVTTKAKIKIVEATEDRKRMTAPGRLGTGVAT